MTKFICLAFSLFLIHTHVFASSFDLCKIGLDTSGICVALPSTDQDTEAWANTIVETVTDTLMEVTEGLPDESHIESNVGNKAKEDNTASNTNTPDDGMGKDDGNALNLVAFDKNGASAPTPTPDHYWIFVGSANGRVVSQPEGIDCNKGKGQCFYYFKRGTKLKLTPHAPEGMYLFRWDGDIGCENGEFIVTDIKKCSAIFYNKNYD